MREPLIPWPAGLRGWLPGLLLSVPLALLLWSLRGADPDLRTEVATAAVLLGLPWVVPAMIFVATLSVPVYMWLHTQGPVLPVLEWLGVTLLIGAVLGAHINGALAWLWMHRGKAAPEPGLGDFLTRRLPSGEHRTNEQER